MRAYDKQLESLADELEIEAFKSLVHAGRKIRVDLWAQSDFKLLADRARDLAKLHRKIDQTNDPDRVDELRLAARLVVENVAMVALRRVGSTADYIVDALERFFLAVALPALASALPELFGALWSDFLNELTQ